MVLRVETSFELSPELKERVVAAIHRVVAPETGVEFALGDDLICGIRLKAGGQTIGWTLAGYLDQLEERALAGLDDMSVAEKRAAE
jgi:F0F1-type ATP synthase delta subunit